MVQTLAGGGDKYVRFSGDEGEEVETAVARAREAGVLSAGVLAQSC